jgi:hypothetical protein
MPSCASSSEAGTGMPLLSNLHERFAAAKESLRDAGLWLLDADETAHIDDLACFFAFKFLLPVSMRCRLSGQPTASWSRPLKDQFPFPLAPEFWGS